MVRRHWGMLATAAIFATGSADAQTAGDARQIDRLEGQIQALQREVGDLKERALTAEKNTRLSPRPPRSPPCHPTTGHRSAPRIS